MKSSASEKNRTRAYSRALRPAKDQGEAAESGFSADLWIKSGSYARCVCASSYLFNSYLQDFG
jgi:hypothetical protein